MLGAVEVAREGPPPNLAPLHLEPMVDCLGHGRHLAGRRIGTRFDAGKELVAKGGGILLALEGWELPPAGLRITVIYEVTGLHHGAAGFQLPPAVLLSD